MQKRYFKRKGLTGKNEGEKQRSPVQGNSHHQRGPQRPPTKPKKKVMHGEKKSVEERKNRSLRNAIVQVEEDRATVKSIRRESQRKGYQPEGRGEERFSALIYARSGRQTPAAFFGGEALRIIIEQKKEKRTNGR